MINHIHMDEIFRKYKEILENKRYYDVVFEPVDGKSYSIYSVPFNKDIDKTYTFNEKQQEAINTAYEQMVPTRSARLFSHSGWGYGTNLTRYLSRKELGAYKNICTSCKKAAEHRFNDDNFLEIIYVYEDPRNKYKKGVIYYTETALIHKSYEEFIKFAVERFLEGSKDEMKIYSIGLGIRIVVSEKEITELNPPLVHYFMRKDGHLKDAFKPRKLKKPSRAKVSKSAQKRRKSKSKRSPKPRRR
jgi:hypothetical protein